MNLEENKLNQDWMRVDARILGQLLAAQNMLFVLPDEKRIEEYFTEALSIVPGISLSFTCLINHTSSDRKPFEECRGCLNSRKSEFRNLALHGKFNCSLAGRNDLRIIALKTKDYSIGFFIFQIESAVSFEPYQPFLSNLANYIAISIENRIQKHLLEKSNSEMEEKIRVRTEQLKQINERFLLATNAAHLGVWDWDIEKNELVWDTRMYELYGIKKGDFAGAYEAWLNGIHPDDRIESDMISKLAQRGEKEYDTEFRVIWPDGTLHYIKAFAQIVRNNDGTPSRMIGINFDITERKIAEAALLESEEKYRTLIQKLQVAIVVHGADTRIIKCNTAAQKLLNLNEDQLLGRTSIDPEWHFSREDNTIMPIEEYPVNLVMASKKELSNYFVGVQSFGKGMDAWCLVNADPVIDGKGEIIEVIVTFVDITERRRVEENLRLSETKFASLFQFSPSPLSVNTVEGHIFIDVNEKLLQLTGYERTEVIGHSISELKLLANPWQEREFIKLLHEQGNVHDYEYEFLKKDGSICTGLLSSTFITIGSEPCFLAQTLDITDRKKAEVNLAKTSIRLNEAQHIAHIGSWELDIPNNVLIWSDEIYKMFEIDSEKFGASYDAFLEAIHPYDREKVNLAYTNSLRTRVPYSIDHRLLFADGRIKYVHEECETFYDNDGRPTRSIGIVQDMTERKKAEEKIKQLAAIVEFSNDAIMGKTLDGIVTSWNKGAEKIYGYTENEMIGTSISILIPPESENDMSIILEKIRDGKYIEHYETKRMKKDGGLIQVSLTISPIEDTEGKIIGASAIGHDITERKRVEENLRVSDERYRLIAENTADTITVCDLELNPVYLSPSIFKLLGYTVQEAMKLPPNQIFTSKSIEKLKEELSKQIALNLSGETDLSRSVLIEIEMYRKNRSVIWAELAASFLRDKNLNPTGILTVARNITDRKQSEEKLRILSRAVEQSPASIVITDLNGNIEYVNSKFSSITGYHLLEALQQNPRILKSGEMSPDHYKDMWQTLTSGKEWQGEFHNKKKNGELYWELASISPVFDTTGTITHFLAVKEDITARKTAEEALGKSEQEFRALAENSPDVIVRYDREGRRIYVNPEFERVNHLCAKQVYGKKPTELSTELSPMANVFTEKLQECMATGTNTKIDLSWTKEGKPICWFVRAVPEFDANGNVISALTIWSDISDRKQAEEEIHKLNQDLERRVNERTAQLEVANKELEAFSYSVSHDLRAPLRAIDGFSLALIEDYQDKIDEQGNNYLQRVRSGAQRMAQLIDDMLTLSHISRREMNLQLVNLSEIFSEVASNLHESQPEREVKIIVPNGITAKGDGRLLRIVFDNLVGNAWKYTSKHSTAYIEFGISQLEEKLVYFIRDDGAGFDMNYAQKLFGAFQRFHSTNDFPGTGIGLATVQRIIHRHGGEIWAESEVEKGTTFYFTIP